MLLGYHTAGRTNSWASPGKFLARQNQHLFFASLRLAIASSSVLLQGRDRASTQHTACSYMERCSRAGQRLNPTGRTPPNNAGHRDPRSGRRAAVGPGRLRLGGRPRHRLRCAAAAGGDPALVCSDRCLPGWAACFCGVAGSSRDFGSSPGRRGRSDRRLPPLGD